ncbi:MAG: ribbon-helix-helix domain-containing protein [Candidatus Bathyarchaeia archaeon]
MPKSIVRASQKVEGEREEARYVSIKIPKELMDEVDRIVSAGILGYKSRMEFIKDAVRDKILRLRAEVSGEKK